MGPGTTSDISLGNMNTEDDCDIGDVDNVFDDEPLVKKSKNVALEAASAL